MKVEFYKFFKNRFVQLLPLLIVLLLFAFSLLYHFAEPTTSEIGYGVQSYDNAAELSELLEKTKSAMDELEEMREVGAVSAKDYAETSEYLALQKNVYEYLSDNDLSYDDVKSVQFIGAYSRNETSFLLYIGNIGQIALCFSAAVIVLLVVTSEFQNGTVRSVYCGRKRRFRILAEKLFVIGAAYCAAALLITLFERIFALPYHNDFGYVIDVSPDGVVGYPASAFSAKILLSLWIDGTFYLLLFTAVALFFKNAYVVIFTDLGLYATLQLFCSQIPVSFVRALAVPYVYAGVNGISPAVIGVVRLVQYGVSLLSVVIGEIYFLRKDLA